MFPLTSFIPTLSLLPHHFIPFMSTPSLSWLQQTHIPPSSLTCFIPFIFFPSHLLAPSHAHSSHFIPSSSLITTSSHACTAILPHHHCIPCMPPSSSLITSSHACAFIFPHHHFIPCIPLLLPAMASLHPMHVPPSSLSH